MLKTGQINGWIWNQSPDALNEVPERRCLARRMLRNVCANTSTAPGSASQRGVG
jgi:hypothetical protein